MGLSPSNAIFDTFFIEMYHYIVHSSSTLYDKFLESIFGFSHILVRGLFEGLSTNYDTSILV